MDMRRHTRRFIRVVVSCSSYTSGVTALSRNQWIGVHTTRVLQSSHENVQMQTKCIASTGAARVYEPLVRSTCSTVTYQYNLLSSFASSVLFFISGATCASVCVCVCANGSRRSNPNFGNIIHILNDGSVFILFFFCEIKYANRKNSTQSDCIEQLTVIQTRVVNSKWIYFI